MMNTSIVVGASNLYRMNASKQSKTELTSLPHTGACPPSAKPVSIEQPRGPPEGALLSGEPSSTR
jgi:hypothetical protein